MLFFVTGLAGVVIAIFIELPILYKVYWNIDFVDYYSDLFNFLYKKP